MESRTILGYQRFLRDPQAWWEERLTGNQMPEMREALESAQPNPGHHALVDLERMGTLRHLVTQNVDNLHRAAGSESISEIHGNHTLIRCIDCVHRYTRDEIPLDELAAQVSRTVKGCSRRTRSCSGSRFRRTFWSGARWRRRRAIAC